MGGAAFDFEPHYVEIAGHQMHYLDEGQGDPILFLHGNPQWTYGWRNIVPLVSPVARVTAPDMIGMGRSDKPDLPYDFFLHLGYLDRFLDALELDRYTLAVHDWGGAGPVSGDAPARSDSIDGVDGGLQRQRLGHACRGARHAREWMEPMMPLLAQFLDPVEGPRLVLEEDAFNDTVQIMTKRTLSDEEMSGYRSVYPTPESRRAQLAWVRNALSPEDQILGDHVEWRHHSESLLRSTFPKLLLHCDEGVINDRNVSWYRDNLPGVEIVRLGEGYHYIQEDQPEAIGKAIADWLPRLPA